MSKSDSEYRPGCDDVLRGASGLQGRAPTSVDGPTERPDTDSFQSPRVAAVDVLQFGGFSATAIREAAREVAFYHAPTPSQADRHTELSEALAQFLLALVKLCPAGHERSTAISRAREAKMWASAAIAMEGR